MQINNAIVSSDESHYLDYWPIVKKCWERIGITPKLIIVSSELKTTLPDMFGVTTLPLIEGIKPSFQAQFARIWAMQLFEGNNILSDLDMIPISESYFKFNVEPFSDTSIVSYCSDAAPLFDGNDPACYILANQRSIQYLIQNVYYFKTWKEFIIAMAELYNEGWSGDQSFLTTIIKQHPNQVYRLNRGWKESGEALNRLDRIGWRYRDEDVKNGLYFDAHLPRPFKENEKLINDLIAIL